tara:strand:- start:1278 stop:3293 length:2016 start_codon:yes stop_codon:yes gene_type:complete
MKITKFMPLLALLYIQLLNADDLTPIKVESSILSNTITENRYPIAIIDSSDIMGSSSIGSNLGSSINVIPGVSNSDYGIAIGQPVIRGLGGSRVKVLSNNNYVSDLSYFSADHPNMVNLKNASQIEVIKGPSSIFNYSGTTGGIVNIITGSITDKLYIDERITIGRTFDSVSEGYSNNVLMKKNINDISLYFSYDKRDHFNYDLPEGSLFEEGAEKHTLNNSDFADKNTLIGLSLIKDWGFIGFSFENSKGTFGIPYHAEEEEEGEEEEHGAHRIFSTHKSDTYTFKGKLDNVPFANSVDFSFNNTNASIKEHEEDGSFKTLNNNATSMNLKLNMDTNESERRVLLGYQHTKSPMSSNAYVPVSDSYDRSLAYFSNTNFLGYDIDLAVRYDNNERTTATKNYEDSAISISSNTAYEINDNLTYNLGYSHVSRSPNMAELFADGKHGPTDRYEKGNNNLEREVSRNIDLGLTYNTNGNLISLNLYRNNINNFIYLKDLGTKNYDSKHQDADWSQKNAIIQGYELSFKTSFPLSPTSYFGSLLGSDEVLVTLSRDDISAVFDNDTYIPRIPSARNMIDIVMLGDNDEKYSVNIIYSEEQSDFSSIETKSNSYLDLGVKYANKIKANEMYDLNLNLFANNLLDKIIRNHASFVKAHVPLPGFSFGFDVSVDYKF